MKHKTQYTTTKCVRNCPFYSTSIDGMQCNHPFFNDKERIFLLFKAIKLLQANNKDPSANMIINQGDLLPSKCPLRKRDLVIRYKLKT